MIDAILGSPYVQAIGWALVHTVWQGAIIAGVLAALLALMQRQSAQARYLVSCAALLVIVVLAAATALRSYDRHAAGNPATMAADSAATVPADDPATPQPSNSATFLESTRTYLPYIFFTWLLGVALLSARLAGGWMRAQRFARRDALDAAPEWQRTVARLSEALGVGRGVRLLHSAAIEVPTVLGFVQPVILLPMTLSGLSPEQIEMILAHELAHIRRHDFLVNLMQTVIETLLFYHPAVWWISGRIRVEREHCCDDAAVAVCGNALQYARALTRLEELRAESATQLAVAANGGSLLDRIRRVAGIPGEASAPARWLAGAGLLSVIALLVIAPSLPLFAGNEPPKPPAPPAPAKAPMAPAAPAAPAPPAHIACPSVSGSHIEVRGDEDADNDGDNDTDEMEAPEPPDPPDAPDAPDAPEAVDVHVGPIHVAPMAIPEIDIPPVDVHIDPKEIAQAQVEARHQAELAMKVDKRYIESLREAGLTVNEHEAMQLHVLGVTASYVRGLREAGLKKLTVRNVIQLRALNITPRLVKELKDMQ